MSVCVCAHTCVYVFMYSYMHPACVHLTACKVCVWAECWSDQQMSLATYSTHPPFIIRTDYQNNEGRQNDWSAHEAQNLLWCTAKFVIEFRLTFQRYMLPPSSGRSVDIQLRTWQCIPEDSELHTRRCENLKSHNEVHMFVRMSLQCQWFSCGPSHQHICSPKETTCHVPVSAIFTECFQCFQWKNSAILKSTLFKVNGTTPPNVQNNARQFFFSRKVNNG
jgi:hypothetical protein